jgi:FdhD protein
MRAEQDPTLPAALAQVPSRRWPDNTPAEDWVAEEVPVALEYNGISHAVMLATPLDLEDFALGFSLAEGLIDGRADLRDLEIAPAAGGLVLRLTISARCEMRLKQRRRNLAGRTGCGLCGQDSLEGVLRVPPRVLAPTVAPAALARAMRELAAAQPLQQRSGGLHAAAWCAPDGHLHLLREDVGRHNALDKLIGALVRGGSDTRAGFVAVTSRASYEMVQKAAQAGIGLLAAVSAPTHLAIRTAQDCGLTLAGFVREGRATVYAGTLAAAR